MFNDKDVVGLMAAILCAADGSPVTKWIDRENDPQLDDCVELAYRLHTKAAERVVRGEAPEPERLSAR